MVSAYPPLYLLEASKCITYSVMVGMKPKPKDDAVVHSLCYSKRDRLRALECPSDIIDQKGGWSSSSVGTSYCKGYELPVLAKRMKVLED